MGKRATPSPARIRAAATDPTIGEILLYGNIGPDDGLSWLFEETSPRSFHDELAALGDVRALHLYINSDGGDVFAAQAIYSQIKRLPMPVTAFIDGLAASSASLVAMAANTVVMPANATMMIHKPWGQLQGNADDHEAFAEALTRVEDGMLAAYAAKTGLAEARIADLLAAETWMSAAQALEMGFADQTEEAQPIAAQVQYTMLGRFRHVPDGLYEQLGIQAAPQHSAYTGNHLHAHPANGSQGGDVQHTHVHSHQGDYNHNHEHGLAGSSHVHIHDEAIAYHDYGTAAESTSWSAPSLSDFTDKQWQDLDAAEKRRIANHYVWSDSGNPPESFSDLGGPHHKPTRSGDPGPAVFAAVSSGRMQQASWASDAGVRRHLASHYHEFDRQAPWEQAATDVVFQDYLRGLARRAELARAR